MEIQERVRDMSNDELKHLLDEYGYKAGPVISTTRRVYENKLIKFIEDAVLAGAASPLSSPNRSSSLSNGERVHMNGFHDRADEDVMILNDSVESMPKVIKYVSLVYMCTKTYHSFHVPY